MSKDHYPDTFDPRILSKKSPGAGINFKNKIIMKKFISWVAAVAILVSVISCREAEELTAVPETNYVNAKLKQDSLEIKTETPSSSGSSNTVDDPPKKDEIKW